MCALISAWLCVLLGLLPVEIQCRALTVHARPHRYQEPLWSGPAPAPAPAPALSPVMDLLQTDAQRIWSALIHKDPPPLHGNPASVERPEAEGKSRGRRHVNGLGGRGHLMRVGCVLGTCQVQNLSHRLYQLIGQSGREDSSPINPRSPHSYGK